jgi:hypothetical protein
MDIKDHGNCQGNTVWALARWRHLVALHEATDALHPVVHIVPYGPSAMVIQIVVDLATIFYIVDYTQINYSFTFTI